MVTLPINGVDAWTSSLTQMAFRAAPCELLVQVTPENREQALKTFAEGQNIFSGLRVQGMEDLSFLADFPSLRYLEIRDQKRVETRHLEHLSNLRGLHLETPGAGIDFASFPELEVFVGDWHNENRHLASCRELRSLRLMQFNPKHASLLDLANMVRLEWLDVIKTSISSLEGLETLQDLRYFKLGYAPKLCTLEGLPSSCDRLRELSLSHLKNIESYVPIGSLSRLRRLKISYCASMPNLHWVRGMDWLDMFSFVETNVLDGDLSPLLDLPSLRYIGTMDKRHYNYKFSEINKILAKRVAIDDGSGPLPS